MTTAVSLPYGGLPDRDLTWTETPMDRDPPWTENPFWTETPLDRDPLWTKTPLWTETPWTENILWTETPLDRDPLLDRDPFLDREPPGQRPPSGQRPPLDRDPPDREHPLDRDSWTETPSPKLQTDKHLWKYYLHKLCLRAVIKLYSLWTLLEAISLSPSLIVNEAFGPIQTEWKRTRKRKRL